MMRKHITYCNILWRKCAFMIIHLHIGSDIYILYSVVGVKSKSFTMDKKCFLFQKNYLLRLKYIPDIILHAPL